MQRSNERHPSDQCLFPPLLTAQPEIVQSLRTIALSESEEIQERAIDCGFESSDNNDTPTVLCRRRYQSPQHNVVLRARRRHTVCMGALGAFCDSHNRRGVLINVHKFSPYRRNRRATVRRGG